MIHNYVKGYFAALKSDAHEYWQSVMDFAYNKWKNDELFREWATRYDWDTDQEKKVRRGVTYEQFIKQLQKYERIAVIFGNMNYQVNNGGFMQWFDNGYGKQKSKILAALSQVLKDTNEPIIRELMFLLQEVNGNTSTGNSSGSRWMADQWDNRFYDIMGKEDEGGAYDILAEWIVDKAALDYGDMILWAAED